ncbi:ABC transporter substrate-binding protein [Robbsia andropogonis]|uniref:ABC transporter substrate-binding protein n=1 Tax=Robbsia andropogonis TaxID=28092 RepID=UPI002A69D4BA|nr:ABC transporter substrate-binding protein [Robbsia andropogonis]
MFDSISRRQILRLGVGGVGSVVASVAGLSAGLGVSPRAFAADGRVLKISTLAACSAVNVPMQWAFRTLLPETAGYAVPDVQFTAKIPQIVQQVIAGTSDLGDGDIASTLAAAEAGADIKIIGLSYNNCSQVVVVNQSKVKSLEAIAENGGTIAVSGIGDFMQVMLLGALERRKIDAKKINFIEMGSSGDRARALLAGRVDAVPMQLEQAAELQKKDANFVILVKPWEEFGNWYSAVLMATSAWLKKPENQRAAVDVIKAGLTAFRKTDADFAWYQAETAKYASSKDLKTADEATLKPVWTTLTTTMNAFPRNMETLTADQVAKVIPYYKSAGALRGTVALHKVIDRTYLDRALKELG